MYEPKPLDTTAIIIPPELNDLIEQLAENIHEVWAVQRIEDGWSYGPRRDDRKKQHPCLIPYDQLPESEKEYDRSTVLSSIKGVLAQGYEIRKKGK